MPRSVDHEERRAGIAEALIRVAGRDGLHAVTMRSVAAESGVSLRLVQYYFETKSRLMQFALEHLERQSNDRWEERLRMLPGRPSARAFVETFVAESLPDDEESRIFHLVWSSYAALAMTDPQLAEQPFVEGPNRLERTLADVLRQAQEDGEVSEELDVSLEATRLLTFSHGLATSVMVGQRTSADAGEVMSYHLDLLFETSMQA